MYIHIYIYMYGYVVGFANIQFWKVVDFPICGPSGTPILSFNGLGSDNVVVYIS